MLIILGQQSNLMLDFSVFTLHIHKTNEKKKADNGRISVAHI